MLAIHKHNVTKRHGSGHTGRRHRASSFGGTKGLTRHRSRNRHRNKVGKLRCQGYTKYNTSRHSLLRRVKGRQNRRKGRGRRDRRLRETTKLGHPHNVNLKIGRVDRDQRTGGRKLSRPTSNRNSTRVVRQVTTDHRTPTNSSVRTPRQPTSRGHGRAVRGHTVTKQVNR